MRVLITGSRTLLGAALVKALANAHVVRTLDLSAGSDGPTPDIIGDPRDRDLAAKAVAECDAVIHTGPLASPGASRLDVLDTATRGTYNLITTASKASRFVLISSLRPFERYPVDWLVNENWAPRPTTETEDLAPYLSELTVREAARGRSLKAVALRLGEVVDDDVLRGRMPDPRWLHVQDAVQAVERALTYEPPEPRPRAGGLPIHIVGAGERTRFPIGMAREPWFGYQPVRDLTAELELAPTAASTWHAPSLADRPGGAARKVVIFGSNGPFGAITARNLASDHVLRLASRRSVEDVIARNRPQAPGAPMPEVLGPPHEHLVVDVTDPEQVMAACRGMEGIVNLTVIRPDPIEAFRVNLLGADNIVRAAIACGIRRVVQTGPTWLVQSYPYGYWDGFALSSDVPAHPGDALYPITKFLGDEICRIHAEEHGLEVPILLWAHILNPSMPPVNPMGLYPFSVSWEDTAQAIRLALHAAAFPHPSEVMNIVGDLPMGKVSNEKAKRLLGWQPRDRFEDTWRRR